MATLANSIRNDSIIWPVGFYIVGLTDFKYTELYLIFLAMVYIVTVSSNCFILSVIWIDYRLHTSKYLAVANLAIVDLVLSSSFIPSMIKMFLVKDNFISFNACLTQMFFYYCFVSLESCSLTVLAYDRLTAICFPLRHNILNAITVMFGILGTVWSFCIGVTVFAVVLMTRLSFCNSLHVHSYFCDYTPVYRLSCNDHTMQWITASALSIIIVFGPLIFIGLSYVCILVAVFRMQNMESRWKALATCTEHLILVAIFFVPIATVFNIEIFFFSFHIDTNIIVMTLSFSSCIPPCLNPIVYSLATKEIKNRIFVVLKKVAPRSAQA